MPMSLLYALLLVIGLAGPLWGQNTSGTGGGGTALSVQEEDGAPTVSGVSTLKFPNGSVTDNGGGSVSVSAGGAGAPTNATYIVQTADGSLSNEQALGALATGIVKNTTTTGVLSIATPGTDYVAPAGNVATATALAANGANCSVGQFPLGVNASGAVESCTTIAAALVSLLASTTTLDEDFSSGTTVNTTIGKLGWAAGNGTVTAQNSEVNHPGLLRRDTSASSGTVAYTSLSTLGGFLPTAATTQDETWRVRLNVNDSDTGMRVGSMANINVDPANEIGFEKEVADTNYFCVTKNTTETRTDSGVAVDTNFHAFRYVRTGTTQVEFYIDGVLKCTHTTNFPAVTTVLMPTAQVFNGAAASKTMDLDQFIVTYSGMVR